jgi:hypothetical protein
LGRDALGSIVSRRSRQDRRNAAPRRGRGSGAALRPSGVAGSGAALMESGVKFVIFIEMINVCWSFFSLYTVMQIYNFLNYYLWRSCITKQADYKIHNTNPYADTTNV